MSKDKNKSVIAWLCECPQIKNNPLYFNFIQAKDNNKQLIINTSEKALERPYVDGSVLKRYNLTIMDYRSVSFIPVVKDSSKSNENIDEFLDVESIIEWVKAQENLRNYPDFGDGYLIDSVEAVTGVPTLNGVDTSLTPALAKYSITIRINYLDRTNVLWS